MPWIMDGELKKPENQDMHFVGYIVRSKVEMGVNSQCGVPQKVKEIMPNKSEEKLITVPIFNLTYIMRDKVSEVVTQSARW